MCFYTPEGLWLTSRVQVHEVPRVDKDKEVTRYKLYNSCFYYDFLPHIIDPYLIVVVHVRIVEELVVGLHLPVLPVLLVRVEVDVLVLLRLQYCHLHISDPSLEPAT